MGSVIFLMQLQITAKCLVQLQITAKVVVVMRCVRKKKKTVGVLCRFSCFTVVFTFEDVLFKRPSS